MMHLIKQEIPHKDIDHDQVGHGCCRSNHHDHVGIDLEGFDVISPVMTIVPHLSAI